MSVDFTSDTWCKFYVVSPENKSIDQCRNHGADHKAYKWSPQIDPRWNNEQKAAYIEGYQTKG